MASLTLVLVFCAFVSLTDSFCYRENLQPGTTHCIDGIDKSRQPVGSTWTNSKCHRCICSSTVMECCDRMGKVVTMTEGCIVKYDYDTCTFDVFHPEDPSINCAYGAVGK